MKRIFFSLFLFLIYVLFSMWVYTYGTENRSKLGVMNIQAYEGKRLYQELNCNACHQIFGLGGYLGPELTYTMSARGKGANYISAFLKYGSKQMPDFHLESDQVEKIIAYLSYIDSAATLERDFQNGISYQSPVSYSE